MFRFIQRISMQQQIFFNALVRHLQQKSYIEMPPKIRFTPRYSGVPGTFVNENVVITGGAQGLGKALAVKLAKLDANVVIWDDNLEALQETSRIVKVTGGHIHSYLCDMSSREDIYKMAEKTIQEVGDITIVINGAEVATEKLLLDTPDRLIQKAFDINALSMFWTTKAFLPTMIDANRGHIVTISSMASHMGIQKLTDYCATKAAVSGFMSALKTELESEGTKGVKTTVLCPYFIDYGTTTVKLRFIQPLKIDEVADRTIEAIKNKEDVVFMPNWFKFALIPRWITPGIISSLLLKVLIKDFNPVPVTGPMRIIQFVKLLGPIESSEPKKEPADDIQKLKELQEKSQRRS